MSTSAIGCQEDENSTNRMGGRFYYNRLNGFLQEDGYRDGSLGRYGRGLQLAFFFSPRENISRR